MIRQQSADRPEELNQAPTLASELMRRLEEKARETEKLKKQLTQAERELREFASKTAKSGSGAGEDVAMQIEALRVKAADFDRKGNLLDAFHLYRRIIRLNPADSGALYQIAELYYSAGMISKAIEVLRMVLELDPAHERAAESLGELEKGV